MGFFCGIIITDVFFNTVYFDPSLIFAFILFETNALNS